MCMNLEIDEDELNEEKNKVKDEQPKHYTDPEIISNNEYHETILLDKNPVMYSIGEVTEQLSDLDIPVTTIRFWTDTYKDYLNVRKSGKNRYYTKHNIEQLRYLYHLLKKQNLTSEQVKAYLKTEEAKYMQPMGNESSNTVANAVSQSVVDGITETLTVVMAQMTHQITSELTNEFTKQMSIMGDRINQLETALGNKLDNVSNEVEAHLHESKEAIDYLRRMEEKDKIMRDKLNKVPEPEKKGIIKRIFGR